MDVKLLLTFHVKYFLHLFFISVTKVTVNAQSNITTANPNTTAPSKFLNLFYVYIISIVLLQMFVRL